MHHCLKYCHRHSRGNGFSSAKLNGVDPPAYLRFVLERIPDHPINRVQELLPWNFAAGQDTQARQAA
jgi:hypothetical protein